MQGLRPAIYDGAAALAAMPMHNHCAWQLRFLSHVAFAVAGSTISCIRLPVLEFQHGSALHQDAFQATDGIDHTDWMPADGIVAEGFGGSQPSGQARSRHPASGC